MAALSIPCGIFTALRNQIVSLVATLTLGMGKFGRCSFFSCLLLLSGLVLPNRGALQAQEAAKALHVIGSVTSTDPTAGTITVKADKTDQQYTFTLADTKTLLKVQPGAKDLKSAVRITAQDLHAQDRVDVRYLPTDAAASPIPARSVLLMSAGELEQAHQAEQQAWQNSTSGTVTAVKPDGSLEVRVRSAEGPKTMTVVTAPTTVYTRYAPETPTAPSRSVLAEIQTGDQVRIVGTTQGDSITAQKIYSGGFRTIPATVVSLDPDNSGFTAKNLQSNQPFHVLVTPETMIRKLPPAVAMGIAHRLNPGASGGSANGGGAGGSQWHGQGQGQQSGGQASSSGQAAWQGGGSGHGGAAGQGGAGQAGGNAPRMGGGDLSRMLEHMPAITVSDLKPGDAVVLSVATGKQPAQFVASAVVAGVEPIFQSTPPRQGGSFSGGDWGLDMSVPAQ